MEGEREEGAGGGELTEKLWKRMFHGQKPGFSGNVWFMGRNQRFPEIFVSWAETDLFRYTLSCQSIPNTVDTKQPNNLHDLGRL